MTRPLLILRPEPGAAQTARAAAALGLRPIVAPLFEVGPVAWEAPDPGACDALLLTSANAVRQAGAGLASLIALPAYAVGEATATAARAAGLVVRAVGDGDATAALSLAAGDGATRLLHLAGREHRDAGRPDLRITRRIVYASEAVAALPDKADAALDEGAVALLHSSRAAALFATLAEATDRSRRTIAIAVLSDAVAAAAGEGWAGVAVAARPADDALLAAAARVCDG